MRRITFEAKNKDDAFVIAEALVYKLLYSSFFKLETVHKCTNDGAIHTKRILIHHNNSVTPFEITFSSIVDDETDTRYTFYPERLFKQLSVQ